MSELKAKRNSKIDSVKTVLIYLVVLGHTIQFQEAGMMNYINVGVKTFIFSFHMPLFILISGYFCNVKCSASTFFKRLIEIFATFLLFQIIRMALSDELTLSRLLRPKYTLWYLLCLIYWRIFMFALSKYKIRYIFLCSIAICLLSGFIHTNILSFQRACAFLPFFVLGKVIYDKSMLIDIDRMKPIFSILLLVICVSLYGILKMKGVDLFSLFKGDSVYYGGLDIKLRTVWLFLSLGISLSIYKFIPDNAFLAKYGGCTFVIYMLHSFFTQRFPWLLDNTFMTNDIFTNVVFALLVMTVCILLGKNAFVKRLVSPIKFKRDKS